MLGMLFIAALLGIVAAAGVFMSVASAMPQAPSNADVVEGRLRTYETGQPLTVADIELRQPFKDRVIWPLLPRLGAWLERSTPDKARQQIHVSLVVAGRPGGLGAGEFIAI